MGLNRQLLKLEAIWFVSGETLGNQDSLLLCTGYSKGNIHKVKLLCLYIWDFTANAA